jgi:hypothetical protein
MKQAKNLLIPSSPKFEEFSSLINNSIDGLKRYNLILTALDAKLFEHTSTPKTACALADELGDYHKTMVSLFCEALVEIGLLVKQNDVYVNSPLTQTYLCDTSPHYMSHALQNMKLNANHWSLLPVILKNGPIMQERKTRFGENWLKGIAEWAEAGSVFTTLKVITTHLKAERWRKLLDLGGGHGLYAIGFTALNPALEAFVFDLPAVMPVTEEYIDAYNAKRVHFLSGDFYKDDIGQGYDAIFSSFNQSCSDPVLVTKIVQALAPGGEVILRRFKDSSREGALKILDWNLQGFEGKKIGSKPHSSDTAVNRGDYLKQLEASGLKILGTFPVDENSEITFAHKPLDVGVGSIGST